jgi:hypothetical protein
MFVTFKNKTIAIQVSFEPLSGGVFVTVFRLMENGVLPEYPMRFDPNSDLQVFDFSNVLMLKGISPVKQNHKLLSDCSYVGEIVSEYATLLRKYGDEFLRGDFRVLPQIKQIISRRADDCGLP